jgi:tetratricopeptide (TPR) repeat protein
MSESAQKAVFLSYASQDTAAAGRICAALRGAGIEVWFDQSELVGGDAWDQKIRHQIRDCALFIPILSQTTQSRREAYFRLEWKLADERTHMIAKGTAFLLPVTIDETDDRGAVVPDSFLAVQWTKLPDGETPAAFASRVKRLLEGGDLSQRTDGLDPPEASPLRRIGRGRPWRDWPAIAFMVLAAVVMWQPWKRPATSAADQPSPELLPVGPVSEATQLVTKARQLNEALDSTHDDYKLADELLAQAAAKDTTDAEVWAAVAQLDFRYGERGFDRSDARKEAGRAAAQRALRFDPQSFEVRLAQVGLLKNTGREGADKEKLLRQLLLEHPNDRRTLGLLATVVNREGRFEEGLALRDRAAALPGGDPLALYNKSMDFWFVGRTAEAETAMRASLAQAPFSGALLIYAWYQMILDGDLAGANATFDRIPPATLQEDRGAYMANYLGRLRRKPDEANAALQAIPRDWFEDNWYTGPKERLMGDDLLQAGHADAAAAEWQAALSIVEGRLTAAPTSEILLYNKIILLARLGQREEAEHQLTILLQLDRIDPRGSAGVPMWVSETYLALGRSAEAIRLVEYGLQQKDHAVVNTAATLRLDPAWDRCRDDPAFAQLIREAETIEQAGRMKPAAIGL